MLMTIVRMYRRWWLKREVAWWGERIELLDRRRRTWEADMLHSLDECAKAKRDLVLLDVTPVSIRSAPGRGPNDGVRRFTLVDDKPTRTAATRRKQLHDYNEASHRG